MKKGGVLKGKYLLFAQNGLLYDAYWDVKACRLRIKSIHIGR